MAARENPRSGNATLWFLTACCLLVGSVGLVLGGREVPGGQPVEPGSTLTLAGPQVSGRAPWGERRQVPAEVEIQSDMAAALGAFWGERWAEVEADLELQGLLFGPLPELRPWDEVQDAHAWALSPISDTNRDRFYRRLMGWPGREFDDHPDQVSASYAAATARDLAEHLRVPELERLDASQLFQLEERLGGTNAELDTQVRTLMEGIGQVVGHQFRTGGPERVPLGFPVTDSYEDDQGFYGQQARVGGWASRVILFEADHPDLAELDRSIRELQRQRRLEVQRVVAELLDDELLASS